MAELQIVPARPSSSAPAVLLSLLVLSIVAVAVFYFNPHRVSDFKVTSVDTYEPHTTFTALEGTAAKGSGMHVLGSSNSTTEVNLYLIAHISLTDRLRLPIFLTGATARATMADGTVLESSLLSGDDLKRLEVIFPEIAHYAPSPVTDGEQIDPGHTRNGTLVLPFPGQTAAAWRGKKAATLTITLRNQQPQVTQLP